MSEIPKQITGVDLLPSELSLEQIANLEDEVHRQVSMGCRESLIKGYNSMLGYGYILEVPINIQENEEVIVYDAA